MKIKRIISALSLIGLLTACDKPDVGYFSYGGIRMQEDTLEVTRGIFKSSSVASIDGSSRPLHFRIVQARNLETGEIVPTFTESLSEVTYWKEAFNGLIDTTMAQVDQKRTVAMMYPVSIVENSGILLFNSSTAKIPEGKYGIDVEVSNSKGSEIITNYCKMKLQSVPFELGNIFRDRCRGAFAGEKFVSIFEILSYEEDQLKLIMEGKHPRRRVTRVGESNIMELEMIIKDANGAPLSPKALEPVWLGSINNNRNTYEANSIVMEGYNEKYTYTDTSAIYRYPTFPYPSFSSEYTGTSQPNFIPMVFYNLSSDYFVFTDAIKQTAAEKGIGLDEYFFQFVNMVTFNEPGKWKLEIMIPEIIKK